MNWIESHFHGFINWYATGGERQEQLWLAGGVVLLFAFLVLAHSLARKLLGHRKFRGTWYNESQWQALLHMTYQDQERGNRVMKRDEIQLLRRWELGRSKGFGSDSGWGK